jgi:hypothetical protein
MFRGLTRMTGFAIGGIVCAAVLAIVAIFAFDRVLDITEPARDQADHARDDHELRFATYEELAELCLAVQDAEGTIRSLEQELQGDPTPSRVTQIDSSLTAIRSSRSRSINEYNSLADRERRAALTGHDLPLRLDRDTKETQCNA